MHGKDKIYAFPGNKDHNVSNDLMHKSIKKIKNNKAHITIKDSKNLQHKNLINSTNEKRLGSHSKPPFS